MKDRQLAFIPILEHSFLQHERSMLCYVLENRDLYTRFAEKIVPDLDCPDQVFSRLAFAVLSANSPFDMSVEALRTVMSKNGTLEHSDIRPFNVSKRRFEAVVSLRLAVNSDPDSFLRGPNELWHGYRLRLRNGVRGLGLAKASFAVCLLYPLQADVACIDTWIQRIFGYRGWRISDETYFEIEDRIRTYARKLDLPSTFICQWIMWSHVRKDPPDSIYASHDIFS